MNPDWIEPSRTQEKQTKKETADWRRLAQMSDNYEKNCWNHGIH